MIEALIGGALLALALVSLAALKRQAARDPDAGWVRRESLQTAISVGIVSAIAIGAAMVTSTIGRGWSAPSAGFAIALAGFAVAVFHGKARSSRG